jgi:hypothetical protein
MNYFKITKIIKAERKESYSLPDSIWFKLSLLFFISLTLVGLAMFEMYAIGKVLIVWFIPVFAIVVYLNLKLRRIV